MYVYFLSHYTKNFGNFEFFVNRFLLHIALKIEFSGPTKKDVYSARVYLEKISSTNLSRQQIHFPRYDAARYRELYNHKVRNKVLYLFSFH